MALELNLSYLQGFNRMREIGFAGMDNNSSAIAMVASTGLTFFLGLHAERWWLRAVALLCSATALNSARGGACAPRFNGIATAGSSG